VPSHPFHFQHKDRVPLIKPDLQPRVFEYIGGIFRAEKSRLLAAGGITDHVHLLASLNKELAVSDAMRIVKASSSSWIHDEFPNMRHFAWQTGYGAFAVSYSNLENVKEYIARQIEHHRLKTFQEEFVEFLQRHDIPYDERYLWD
jgi:putative transposase